MNLKVKLKKAQVFAYNSLLTMCLHLEWLHGLKQFTGNFFNFHYCSDQL